MIVTISTITILEVYDWTCGVYVVNFFIIPLCLQQGWHHGSWGGAVHLFEEGVPSACPLGYLPAGPSLGRWFFEIQVMTYSVRQYQNMPCYISSYIICCGVSVVFFKVTIACLIFVSLSPRSLASQGLTCLSSIFRWYWSSQNTRVR